MGSVVVVDPGGWRATCLSAGSIYGRLGTPPPSGRPIPLRLLLRTRRTEWLGRERGEFLSSIARPVATPPAAAS